MIKEWVYIITPLIAWAVAQGLKHVVHMCGKNRHVFTKNTRSFVMLSGGMPSAHSATVASLAMIIGLAQGFSTSIFALSLIFAVIVMYDAVMVRRSSGDQGDALNILLKEKNHRSVRVAHGHLPFEVFVGACVGVCVALGMYSICL